MLNTSSRGFLMITAFFAAGGANMLSGSLQNFLTVQLSEWTHWSDGIVHTVLVLVFLGATILFSWITWHNRRRLVGVYLREQDITSVRKARSLIFFVSRQNELTQNEQGDWLLLGTKLTHAVSTANEDGDACRRRLHQLNKEIDNIMGSQPGPRRHFAWQQILRGVHPHIKHVKSIHLIGSSNQGPNQDQSGTFAKTLDLAVPFLSSCLEGQVQQIETVIEPDFPTGVDFEDFEKMRDLLRKRIQRIRQARVRESQITIDITGGQKTAGITAAAITLETDASFQYVQTSAPHQIRHYDIDFWFGDSAENSG